MRVCGPITLGVVVGLLWLAPARAYAADAPASATETPDGTTEARRHFKLGIRLYQDTNYSGALAEFEAAYATKPGAGSLQNVALCQKALFRYREASSTLQDLLAKHSAELSEGEQKAVRDAIAELDGLVGSISITVDPADAKVSVDGRALLASELRMVELNVGEHTVIADEPGYARLVRVVSVASGAQKLPVEMKLKATDAFLSIVCKDPHAAIAIDGVTLAFHEWRGPVKPDVDHLLQVFREGYESYETTLNVPLGKTLEVKADLGAATSADNDDKIVLVPGEMPKAPPPHTARGYYGLLTLSILGLTQKPLELSSRSGGAMGTLGLRAGYRLLSPLAAEVMLDYGGVRVDDAKSNNAAMPETRKYSLAALRFGPNIRLMTTGNSLRFSSTIGAGVVHHTITLDPVAGSPTLTGGTARGFDVYFMLELGLQKSFGHWLLGAEVRALIDGASGTNQHTLDVDQRAPFASTNTLPLLGIGIHGGYGLW